MMKKTNVIPAKAGIYEKPQTLPLVASWMPAYAGMTVAFIALTLPAFAGNLNFSNGKGLWQSTLCNRPVPPAFVGLSSDASAATMNAATASYNLFVKQSQDYQACLSNEAKVDGDSANGLIMQTVQRQMQDAQGEVERTKGQLFGKAPPPQPVMPQQPQPVPPQE